MLAACTASGIADLPPTPSPVTLPAISATVSATPTAFAATATERVAAAPARSATPGSGPGGCTLSADFIGQSTVPDSQQLAPGTAFMQTWAVRNIGTCTWGDGYTLVFVGGEPFGGPATIAVPATGPGAIANLAVQLAAPGQAGTYSGSWAIQARNEVSFGQHTVTIHVAAPPTAVATPTPILPTPAPPTPAPTPLPSATVARCVPAAAFVADLPIPGGTAMAPGTPFIKTWRVRNTGTCGWDASYQLIFRAGNPMGAPLHSDLPLASPGALADISLRLIAPQRIGNSFGRWALADGDGAQLLDLELVITVVVDSQVTATTTPTIDPIHVPVPQSVPPTITPIPTQSNLPRPQ
jgi:hypothetical protein